MNIKKLLGQKIKQYRKQKGLTQEELAEIIEIAPRNLSRIEVGESFVTADTLEKIINALDVSPEYLFSNNEIKDSKILLNEIYIYLDSIKNNKIKLQKIYKVINFFKHNEI